MYVDDVIAGSHSEQEAISMIRELRAALGSAGFPLRKWTSNHKALLHTVPVDNLLNLQFLVGAFVGKPQVTFFFCVKYSPKSQSFSIQQVG